MGSLWDILALQRARARGQSLSDLLELHAKIGSYYLGRNHALIHRHRERVSVSPEQTARWELSIDLSLPTEPRARCGKRNGAYQFLFPLMFLKKSEGRTGLGAEGADGAILSLMSRESCDWISGIAATEAVHRLEGRKRPAIWTKSDGLGGETDDLRYVLQCIASRRPYDSAVILNELLDCIGPDSVKRWTAEGLTGDLKMLVEHSLVWVPLEGQPGERRVIKVSQDWELLPKSLLNWKIGPAEKARSRRRRRKLSGDPNSYLDTGDTRYACLARRMSFSVLGERLAQPLAWMPIEMDFPTIYTRRCSSYHFELVCPNGLSPHGIKVAIDRQDHPGERIEVEGGETVGTRAAEIYLPGGRMIGDLLIRATVGIGRGAFPVLWFLMGAITAGMLWTFAASNPVDLIGAQDSSNEIAAGILLIVPALLGAIVVGAEQGPTITRLIGGARILLLVSGLASALAATVLLGREPLGLSPRSQWTIYAALTTAATVPLATSWLLSLRLIWPRLKRLNTTRKQNCVLLGQVLLALASVVVLQHLGGSHDVLRASIAGFLLAMTVPMILVASNRLAVPMDEKRDFLSLSAFLAALVCLLLGCVELRAAFDSHAQFHEVAEELALVLLFIAPATGPTLATATAPFHERDGEVHVAPAVAEALFEGRRIRELHRLRPDEKPDPEPAEDTPTADDPYPSMPIDQPVAAEPVGTSAADWSTSLRSTVDLPRYEPDEFRFLIERPSWKRPDPSLERLEREVRARLASHMAALRMRRRSAPARQ
ncbi:MAG: hypothetical protein QOF85_550 [Solirubrobacterales bacterium]|jgi:hypothetical protein|nr:hypothetical protein [Solirubrobacterales bacterium]